MRAFSRGLATMLLFLTSAVTMSAQKVEFSADMRVTDGAGQTRTLKLFVGNMRARFDLKPGDDPSGIGSILLDFDHQSMYLLVPQANLYLQIEGSAGTAFYSGAWMFRPYAAQHPCNDWVSEADRRGISLRCKLGGNDVVDGRPTQRWDATTPEAGHGSLWYDPELNFIVKVQRISKSGVQSGYELQNAKQETQPPALFELPNGSRKFTLTKLADIFVGIGQ
ncbi:MAG TPA: hypothetical protein VFI38_09250 [Candidatus Acidoferrum sp.]|nr:hypothetical protein [Candidatus Acidoferrum sp.]